jgi:hypothetical protein
VTPSVELIGGKLGVQIINDRDIVVSSAETNFSITYRKEGLAPMLVAINGMGRLSEPYFLSFARKPGKPPIKRPGPSAG